MPRQIVETLIGYVFQIGDGELPKIGKDGQPIYGMDGQPKTEPCKTLVLIDPGGGHVVQVPLIEAAQKELIRQLTGVTIPTVEVPAR